MYIAAMILDKNIFNKEISLVVNVLKNFRLDKNIYLKYKNEDKFKTITIKDTRFYGKSLPLNYGECGYTFEMFLNETNIDFENFDKYLYIEIEILRFSNVIETFDSSTGELVISPLVTITKESTLESVLSTIDDKYIYTTYIFDDDIRSSFELKPLSTSLGNLHMKFKFEDKKIKIIDIWKYLKEDDLHWKSWNKDRIDTEVNSLMNWLFKNLKSTGNIIHSSDNKKGYEFTWGNVWCANYYDIGESCITIIYNQAKK